MTCAGVDELLGAYLLTALGPVDQTAVEGHLVGCDRHQESIHQLSGVVAEIGLGVGEREPRPELRTRILDAIRLETAQASVSLGWSRERLAVGSHACVFHSDDEGLKGTMAFLRAGLDQPEEFGVVFADHKRFGALAGWLQEGYAGSVSQLIDRGKLAMIAGAATSDDLIKGIGGRLDQALADGYRIIRLLGFIGWDQPGWPDTAAIADFEQRVNEVVRNYPIVVVCTYDLPRLGGLSVMEGGLRNHPITIMGHRIVRNNPFYLAA